MLSFTEITMNFFLIFSLIIASSFASHPRVIERFRELRDREINGFVAGGRPTVLGEIPYYALIYKLDGLSGETSQCGGSLVRYNWVLTVSFLDLSIDFESLS